MRINKEFFNFFKGYNASDVANALLALKDNEKDIILSIWGEKPTQGYNVKATEIINKIKINISKKSLKKTINIYNEFELSKELNKLSLKEKNTLLKEYYIDNLTPKESLTNEEKKMNRDTIMKLKRKRTRIVGENSPSANYKVFYKVFEGYEKSLVDKLYDTLDEKEKNLLRKKFGDNLDSFKINNELTDYENYLITQSITVRMKRKLSAIKEGRLSFVRIEDLYPDIDRGLLVIRSEKMRSSDRERYYRFFGTDLSKEALIYDTELEKLNSNHCREIMENKMIINKQIRSLEDILISFKLENETKEDFEYRIKKALANLSGEEMKILKRKYGNELNKTINYGQYTLEEDYFMSHHIIPKIKRFLKLELTKKEYSLIYTFNMSKDELDTFVTNNLTMEEIQLLKKKYGNNYNEINLLSQEENLLIISILTKMKNIIKSNAINLNISFEKLSLVRDILRFKKYDEIKKYYNDKIALASLLINYLDDIISDEEFNIITGFTKEEINNLINEDDNLRKLISHRRLKKN